MPKSALDTIYNYLATNYRVLEHARKLANVVQ